MSQEKEKYNPLISSHLDDLEESWGNPEENIKNIVTFGIRPFDALLYGIDLGGELIVIQGEEKNRKTTATLNIVKNVINKKPKLNVVVDTLESSMNYMRYRDSLIAMLMTEYLIKNTAHSHKLCRICRGSCKIIGHLSPEAFRYKRDRFPQVEFNQALAYAKERLSPTRLRIYDGRIERGNARNLGTSLKRWTKLRKEGELDLLVLDHLQQYKILDIGHQEAYSKLEVVIGEVGNFIAQYGVPVILLSQVSLTSRRTAKSAKDYMSTGGAKADQEAKIVFNTKKIATGRLEMSLKVSRSSGTGKVEIELEPSSGLFTKVGSIQSLS